MFLSPNVFSDHHKHSHEEDVEETKVEDEVPALKKQALEKTEAGDPMAMNWNVDKMEE
jgi:hypothetical protein